MCLRKELPTMKAKDTPGTLAAQESSPLTRPKNSKRKSSRATTYEPSSPSPMPKKTKTKGPKVLYKPSSPWDADCCAILLDKVIAHGVKTADLGAIAAEVRWLVSLC